ncbi:sel1 repeat family protein [Myroides sp. M-43]|uniref:tetratricopeptide repeat protein n=1 Tax=Myroides oncorhynchi TaxID=2893756 RepID=UPI001E369E3C|nr:tetratricopeptide repeat protein [Myroides oncorhynchi]MCC9043221.1 sel1 repeat family protein [Myroides oncorhynchi]
MGHRHIVTNIDLTLQGEVEYHFIGEWKYEIPLFFFPLFCIPVQSKELKDYSLKPSYLLYFRMKEAIPLFEQFHQWIQSNIDTLIPKEHQPNYFESYNKQIYYFNNLEGDSLVLDGSDVYNMNEGSHKKLAKEYLVTLERLAVEFKELLNSNASVEQFNHSDIASYFFPFSTFKEYLNNDNANYGWDWLEVAFEKNYDFEHFEENELWGIRKLNGEIILPPLYEGIGEFEESGLAYIILNDKCGLIDKQGNIILEPVWDYVSTTSVTYLQGETDKADDYQTIITCSLEKDNKYALYNLTEKAYITDFIYDEIELLKDDYYNVLQGELYAIFNYKGKECIPFTSTAPFEYYFQYFCGKQEDNNIMYSNEYGFIGNFDYSDISDIGTGNCLLVPSANGPKLKKIIDAQGELILDNVKMAEGLTDKCIKVITDQGMTIYDLELKENLIEYVKGRIEKYILMDINLQIGQVYISSGKKKGVFDCINRLWAIPLQVATELKVLGIEAYAIKNNLWNITPIGQTAPVVEDCNYIALHPLNYEPQVIVVYKDKMLYQYQDNVLEVLPHTQLIALATRMHYNQEGEVGLFKPYFMEQTKLMSIGDYLSLEPFYIRRIKDYYLENDFTEAYEQLLSFAEQLNDDELLNELAYRHLTEEQYIDYPKAMKLFLMASELGNHHAATNIGYIYFEALGVPYNSEEGLKYYILGAERGNNQAKMNLAALYYEGAEGIEANYQEALKYFLPLEKVWDFYVSHYIADCYFLLGEYKKAMKYIKKDIKEEDHLGSFLMGKCYNLGYEVKQDTVKAIEYFEQAVQKGYTQAVTDLLYIYAYDETHKNSEKLAYYLEMAKEHNVYIPNELQQKSFLKNLLGKWFR